MTCSACAFYGIFLGAFTALFGVPPSATLTRMIAIFLVVASAIIAFIFWKKEKEQQEHRPARPGALKTRGKRKKV